MLNTLCACYCWTAITRVTALTSNNIVPSRSVRGRRKDEVMWVILRKRNKLIAPGSTVQLGNADNAGKWSWNWCVLKSLETIRATGLGWAETVPSTCALMYCSICAVFALTLLAGWQSKILFLNTWKQKTEGVGQSKFICKWPLRKGEEGVFIWVCK